MANAPAPALNQPNMFDLSGGGLHITFISAMLAAEMLPMGPIEHMVETSLTLARVRLSEDMREGIAAYREKRKPVFRGREKAGIMK